MRRRKTLGVAAVLAAGALLGWLASGRLAPDVQTQDKQAAAEGDQAKFNSPEFAALRKTAREFIAAFI